MYLIKSFLPFIAVLGIFAIFLWAFFWPRQDSAADEVAPKPNAKSAEVLKVQAMMPEPSPEPAPEQIEAKQPPKQEMDWSTYGVPAYVRMGRSI